MKRLLSKLLACTMALSCLQMNALITPVYAETNEEITAEQLDMPVISIDTCGNAVSTKESYVDAKVTVWDEKGGLNMDSSDISIRLRGNITLNLDKKSYKIKFPTKQNPIDLGDGSGKTWNLVANYYDTSLLRNITAYHLGDLMNGIPYTPNSRSVEVYVNGEYQGVYLLCEAVNVNKNRVAIAETPENIEDNGYLLEMTRYAEENVFSAEFAQYEVKSDLSEDTGIREKQIEYISGYTSTALEALKSGDADKAEQYIDKASLVDNYIANEICKNVDSGWDSYYLAKDAGGKLMFEPMWDYDLALGNNSEAKGMTASSGLNIFNVSNCNANSNPWFCYAMQSQWFREAVAERWEEMYATLKTVPDFVTEEAEENARSYARNFTKWNTLGQSVYNEPKEIADLATHTAHAEYLSTWLDERISWLNDYFSSEDFAKGVFLDENGKEIDAKNAVAVSPLMFWGGEGSVDVNSPGFESEATNSAWGAQAISSGIMLEEGQKYKLSFDYSSTGDATVNYRIQQNHDRYTPYFRDSAKATAEVQHLEKEFTATASDSNCALVLQFAGQGTVKVEHLSLVVVEAEALYGDINLDGDVTPSDVIAFIAYFLHKLPLTGQPLINADVTGDGQVSLTDLATLKQFTVGDKVPGRLNR